MRAPKIWMGFGLILALVACGERDRAWTDRDVSEKAKHHEYLGRAGDMFHTAQLASLAQSACLGDLLGIQKALKDGASPNGIGNEKNWETGVDDQYSVLWWALDCRSALGTKALLDAGADPNLTPPRVGDDFSPINLAAGLRDPTFLRLLLRYHANPNENYVYYSHWPLSRAFDVGLDESDWTNFYELLRGGADPNHVYRDETIATYADDHRRYDKVEELLQSWGYSHDLEILAIWIDHDWKNPPAGLTPAQRERRDRVLSILKEKGIRFPVPKLSEYLSGEVQLNDDNTLTVDWHSSGPLPGGKGVKILAQNIKPTDPAYQRILKRVGGLSKYETKSIVRQPGDPLP